MIIFYYHYYYYYHIDKLDDVDGFGYSIFYFSSLHMLTIITIPILSMSIWVALLQALSVVSPNL